MKGFFCFLMVMLAVALAADSAYCANRLISLRTDNTLVFRGEVSDASVAEAELKLVELLQNRKDSSNPIYIVLDSPGGSIDAGEQFIQFAKRYTSVETLTLFSASMAAGIVEGLPGRRLIAENGTLMFHRARGGVEGQFSEGELESRLNYAKQVVNSMEIRNADRIGVSLRTYKNVVKDELWLYGPLAEKANGVDEVVDVVCSKQLIEGTSQATMSIMGLFTITVESSTCPLLKAMKIVGGTDAEAKALQDYLKSYTSHAVSRR